MKNPNFYGLTSPIFWVAAEKPVAYLYQPETGIEAE